MDPSSKPFFEIERKFALSAFPDLPEEGRSLLRQGYLSTRPVVRIRSRQQNGKTAYRLCIKGSGGLIRREVELELDAERFAALTEMLPVPPIEKEQRTYRLPDGSLLECNCVEQGRFFYAEVEFSSAEAAEAFVPPEFLGEELTGRPGFSMSAYWEQRLSLLSAERQSAE